MKNQYKTLLAGAALISSCSALAEEPILDVVCAYSARTQIVQVFNDGETHRAAITVLETGRKMTEQNVIISNDFVQISRPGLKENESSVLTLSRVTGQMNLTQWETKDGKRIPVKNTKMASCVKNEPKF